MDPDNTPAKIYGRLLGEKPMRRKSLRTWIREHRAELDECIARALKMDHNPRANDDERRLWVLNDEGLYRWARKEVNV